MMIRVNRFFVGCVGVLGLLLSCSSLSAGVLIEGFEDGNIAEYTFTGGTTTSVSGANAHDGSFGLGISGSGWIYRDDAAVQLSQGDTFSSWVNFNDVANGRAYFGFGSSAAGTLSFVLAPNSGDIRFQENPGYSFTELDTVAQTFIADKWYRAEVVWGVGGSLTGNLYDSDGTTLINSVSSSSTLYSSGGLAFRGFGGVKGFDTVMKSAEIPEPASIAIFGVGALGLVAGGIRRRRRQQAAC